MVLGAWRQCFKGATAAMAATVLEPNYSRSCGPVPLHILWSGLPQCAGSGRQDCAPGSRVSSTEATHSYIDASRVETCFVTCCRGRKDSGNRTPPTTVSPRLIKGGGVYSCRILGRAGPELAIWHVAVGPACSL